MNSATRSLSSPSQQYPIKLAKRSLRRRPTVLASSYNTTDTNTINQQHRNFKSLSTEPIKIGAELERATNHELASIRPSRAVEALDGDRVAIAVVKDAFVDHIRSFLSVLRYYILRQEPRRGGPQLVQAELLEYGKCVLVLASILYTSFFFFEKYKTQNWARHVPEKATENEKKRGKKKLTGIVGLVDAGLEFNLARNVAEREPRATSSHWRTRRRRRNKRSKCVTLSLSLGQIRERLLLPWETWERVLKKRKIG